MTNTATWFGIMIITELNLRSSVSTRVGVFSNMVLWQKVPVFGFGSNILVYKPYISDISIDDKHGSFCINHISEIWPNHTVCMQEGIFKTKQLITFKSWMQNPVLQKVCPLLHNRRYSFLLTFFCKDKHKSFRPGFCHAKICTSNLIPKWITFIAQVKKRLKYESSK